MIELDQIIAAYKETGSVWKAGKRLGLAGQVVWERLHAFGYKMRNTKWTKEEYEELEKLAHELTIGQIARRLGRSYAGVALKLSRIGLAKQSHGWMRPTIKRGYGWTARRTKEYIALIRNYKGKLRPFCRQHGIDIENLVRAIQRYDIEFWKEYTREHADLAPRECPYCRTIFYPLSGKQRACTRKCSDAHKRDVKYFGGKRQSTIGLAQGICQLCGKAVSSGLSAHHVLGRDNDPDNAFMVALCQGCHHIVGCLGGRNFVESCEAWENLIQLALMRKLAEPNKAIGFHVTVEIKRLTEDDINDIAQGEDENEAA